MDNFYNDDSSSRPRYQDGNRGDNGYNGNRQGPRGNQGNSYGQRRSEPRDEVYSKQVRAGKRRYFFDVRDTRGGDFYLTITEMKRGFEGEAPEKHKLFLYKEDFTKFVRGLQDTIDYIKSNLLTPDQVDELERGDAQYEEDEQRYREQRQQRQEGGGSYSDNRRDDY